MRDRKVRLEVHIGPDDDARGWVIASVDGEEALRHGPYEHQADAGGGAKEELGATPNPVFQLLLARAGVKILRHSQD